jgi:nucleotide-binding universal stress UspA family protein
LIREARLLWGINSTEKAMLRSLLVPLDGSQFGEHALPMALSLARRLGAPLEVVHVHVSAREAGGEVAAFVFEAVDRGLRERSHAYLNDVIHRLTAATDISVSTALLEGPIADTIIQHAAETAADLIVMTTHGRGPLARFWLGSVADTLLRKVPMPMLLVQPKEGAPSFAQEQVIRRMLIPLDGSELAEQILEPALVLGAATQSEYTLLRVVKPLTPAAFDPTTGMLTLIHESLLKQLQDLDAQRREEAQEYLERVAATLRARSLTVQTRVVTHEQPARGILDDAEKNAIDLIALATHGRGGLKRMLLGSVADKVLRGATMPVLVSRPVATPSSTEGDTRTANQE